jgi:glutathione S-transferase
MKLYFSPNSPFVRKVMVTAHELGVAGRIEPRETNVWEEDAALTGANPLGQIPTLICDDGEPLYDSDVICEYLDAAHGDGRLVPRDGPERWRMLRLKALGNGLLGAAVIRALEIRRRPETLRWPELIERQRTVMCRVSDELEERCAGFRPDPDLGQIAVVCALGYVDLRMPEDAWRAGRPALARWFERFAARPSFAETAPPSADVRQQREQPR